MENKWIPKVGEVCWGWYWKNVTSNKELELYYFEPTRISENYCQGYALLGSHTDTPGSRAFFIKDMCVADMSECDHIVREVTVQSPDPQ